MAIDAKYGKVTVDRIGDDEPIVIFRAQDVALPALLRDYRARCHNLGSPDEHLDSIAEATARVEKWQKENDVKVPD